MAKQKTLFDTVPFFKECHRLTRRALWTQLRYAQWVRGLFGTTDMQIEADSYRNDDLEWLSLINPNVTLDQYKQITLSAPRNELSMYHVIPKLFPGVEYDTSSYGFSLLVAKYGKLFFTSVENKDLQTVYAAATKRCDELTSDDDSIIPDDYVDHRCRVHAQYHQPWKRLASNTGNALGMWNRYIEKMGIGNRSEGVYLVSGILTPEAELACQVFERESNVATATQNVKKIKFAAPANSITLNLPAMDATIDLLNGKPLSQMAVREAICEYVDDLYKQVNDYVNETLLSTISVDVNGKQFSAQLMKDLLEKVGFRAHPSFGKDFQASNTSLQLITATFHMLLARKTELESKLVGDNATKRTAATFAAKVEFGIES